MSYNCLYVKLRLLSVNRLGLSIPIYKDPQNGRTARLETRKTVELPELATQNGPSYEARILASRSVL